jgi:hypothetical protein
MKLIIKQCIFLGYIPHGHFNQTPMYPALVYNIREHSQEASDQRPGSDDAESYAQ